MLEGLEITIKQFSELSNSDDDTLRFDAEHYQHRYLAMVNQLKLHQHSKLLDLIRKPVITGHTPSMQIDRFYDGNIAFIKTDNLRENQIVDSYTDYLTEAGDAELKSSRLKLNDILVTIIGATPAIVGRCAIVREEHLPANINQNIALIEAENTKINPNYLNIYLNSKFGRGMLHFHSRQTEQVNLNCREVERVLVPLFPELESVISDLSNQSSKLKATSKALYAQAEQTLLEAVGLAGFKPSTQITNIKTFAQSFGTSGRLDAEYYQPKYEDYLKLIFDYKDGWARLSEVCELKDTNFNPIDDVSYQYIELSDIDKSGGITGCTNDIGANLPSRARRFVNAGDVVVSSIEGSLSSCALVSKDYDSALCSTGFYVIKSQAINAETLLVLMKSELMQNLLKQSCSGSILTALNKDEFSNLPIPKIRITTFPDL